LRATTVIGERGAAAPPDTLNQGCQPESWLMMVVGVRNQASSVIGQH
jgi:hypothetical protein